MRFFDTKIQTRVFAFLDLDHPPVAWAVMRGMLVSADFAAPEPGPGFISFMQAGMIEHQNNARIFNELAIESIRESIAPKSVSRLRGMYFFGSYDEAIARVGDPNWPNYFTPQNLVEFELHAPEAVTIVDSEWITCAPRDHDNLIDTRDLRWVEKYWKGEVRGAVPKWEYIAKGLAVVLDETVRRKCYAHIKGLFPKSEIPILMARLAGEAGSRGGLIAPFLLRKDDEVLQLAYLWSNLEFQDPEVISSISNHPDSGYLGSLMFENETWPIPDFRPWQREFRVISKFDPKGAVGSVHSVHHV